MRDQGIFLSFSCCALPTALCLRDKEINEKRNERAERGREMRGGYEGVSNKFIVDIPMPRKRARTLMKVMIIVQLGEFLFNRELGLNVGVRLEVLLLWRLGHIGGEGGGGGAGEGGGQLLVVKLRGGPRK